MEGRNGDVMNRLAKCEATKHGHTQRESDDERGSDHNEVGRALKKRTSITRDIVDIDDNDPLTHRSNTRLAGPLGLRHHNHPVQDLLHYVHRLGRSKTDRKALSTRLFLPNFSHSGPNKCVCLDIRPTQY